jgi:hypothetical protein
MSREHALSANESRFSAFAARHSRKINAIDDTCTDCRPALPAGATSTHENFRPVPQSLRAADIPLSRRTARVNG